MYTISRSIPFSLLCLTLLVRTLYFFWQKCYRQTRREAKVVVFFKFAYYCGTWFQNTRVMAVNWYSTNKTSLPAVLPYEFWISIAAMLWIVVSNSFWLVSDQLFWPQHKSSLQPYNTVEFNCWVTNWSTQLILTNIMPMSKRYTTYYWN